MENEKQSRYDGVTNPLPVAHGVLVNIDEDEENWTSTTTTTPFLPLGNNNNYRMNNAMDPIVTVVQTDSNQYCSDHPNTGLVRQQQQQQNAIHVLSSSVVERTVGNNNDMIQDYEIRQGEQIGKYSTQKEIEILRRTNERGRYIDNSTSNLIEVGNQMGQYKDKMNKLGYDVTTVENSIQMNEYDAPTRTTTTTSASRKTTKEDDIEVKKSSYGRGGYQVTEYGTSQYDTQDYNVSEYKSVYE